MYNFQYLINHIYNKWVSLMYIKIINIRIAITIYNLIITQI